MNRPFRILGLQQIAIGGPDRMKLRHLWVDVFGLGLEGDFTSERENVVEDIAVLGTGPTRVEVDLMQPLDPSKKPRVDEPALNHIGLWVDDLPKAVEWMTAQGMRFTPGGIRRGAAGFDIASAVAIAGVACSGSSIGSHRLSSSALPKKRPKSQPVARERSSITM